MASKGEHTVFLHKIDDRTALDMYHQLRSHFNAAEEVVVEAAHHYRFTLAEWGEENFKSGTYTIRSLSAKFKADDLAYVIVTFSRHFEDAAIQSIYADKVTLNFGQEERHWKSHGNVMRACIETVSSFDTPVAFVDTGSAPDILRELMLSNSATHRQMIDSLNESVKEMIARREEIETRATELELAREQAHTAALDKLEEERAALQRQSHMSERRGISQQIVQRLIDAKKASLKPKGAQWTGWAVFGASVLVGLIASASLYWALSAYQVRSDAVSQIAGLLETEGADTEAILTRINSLIEPTNWYLIVRSVLSSLVAIGAFTYAASWMKRYYDEDIRLVRELERFNDDVQRASWIVEAVHEVQHEQKGNLPPQWVEAVTKNLFDKAGQSRGDDGVEALRALMGFTASASFGPDGPRFDINRRGLRRMNQADTNSTEE